MDIPVIKEMLTNSKVSFHEYKWQSEKKKGYIIRGLVGINDDDLEFIKGELISAGLPEQLSLSIFKSGYMRAHPNKDHNTLIRMILPPNADTSLLSNIKLIDHVVVKFEPIISSGILQCKNCQRFGHSSSGCQHAHRCVKCGANHFKNTCPRSLDKKNTKLKCCNCEGEHTANNLKECSFAQKILANINIIKESSVNNNMTNSFKNKVNGTSSSGNSDRGVLRSSSSPGLSASQQSSRNINRVNNSQNNGFSKVFSSS